MNFSTSKRLLTLGASLAALSLGSVAQAQDKNVMIKMSSWVPAQHALNPALQAWGESLKKASGGSLNTTLFPSEQLGKAFDHYDMARDGIADFSYVNPGYQPGRFPIFAATSLPFMITNAKAGSAAVDAWYRNYAAKEMKEVHFCFAFVHDPGAFHSRKKIVSPTDIKGMKVRPATATVGQVITMLGGTNVQASAPESRDMLERGVADAITFPWGSLTLFGIDKVVKYHMDVPFYVTPFVWVMNKDKYTALSTTQKAAVDSHCTSEWAEKVGSAWADFEMAGHTKLAADTNREVYKLTPDQIKAWKDAVAPAEKQWGEDVKKRGEDPAAVMNALRQSLAKYKSAM
ncbi:TRAP transporter substrate-binding protein [Limnohabitans sp. Jir72]|uniref:TRAP transporter substrate-binding protein n=1 Tax=Limnohabitans sp. Jir72 TaxID=1977909 RepID=UPI000D3CD4FB|nr:TRAP transporter substrate-binding protein [Limnohabitans sp. Jir72]